MLQGLSETQPSILAKDYSMNEKNGVFVIVENEEVCLLASQNLP